VECSHVSAAWARDVSAVAIFSAIITAGGIFWAYGVNPIHAYVVIAHDVLVVPGAFPEIFRSTIPLLLTGVGLVLAFRAQFYNIGAEGQLLAGTVAATGWAVFTAIRAPMPLPG